MNTKKLTKKEILNGIMALATTGTCHLDPEIISDYCEKEIAILDNKAQKARARAAQKRNEPDALRDAIADVLSEDWQTFAQIAEKLPEDLENVTAGRIIARLTQLGNAGIVQRKHQNTSVDGKRRSVTVYAKV